MSTASVGLSVGETLELRLLALPPVALVLELVHRLAAEVEGVAVVLVVAATPPRLLGILSRSPVPRAGSCPRPCTGTLRHLRQAQ